MRVCDAGGMGGRGSRRARKRIQFRHQEETNWNVERAAGSAGASPSHVPVALPDSFAPQFPQFSPTPWFSCSDSLTGSIGMTRILVVIGLQVCRRLWLPMLGCHPFLDSSAASRRDAKAGIRDAPAKSPWVSPVVAGVLYSHGATGTSLVGRGIRAALQHGYRHDVSRTLGSPVCLPAAVNKCAACFKNTHNGFALSFSRNDSARLLPGVGLRRSSPLSAIAFRHASFAAAKRSASFDHPPKARGLVDVWAKFQSTALNRLDG